MTLYIFTIMWSPQWFAFLIIPSANTWVRLSYSREIWSDKDFLAWQSLTKFKELILKQGIFSYLTQKWPVNMVRIASRFGLMSFCWNNKTRNWAFTCCRFLAVSWQPTWDCHVALKDGKEDKLKKPKHTMMTPAMRSGIQNFSWKWCLTDSAKMGCLNKPNTLSSTTWYCFEVKHQDER